MLYMCVEKEKVREDMGKKGKRVQGLGGDYRGHVFITYVTVYAEIGHMSAKLILRYRPRRSKR